MNFPNIKDNLFLGSFVRAEEKNCARFFSDSMAHSCYRHFDSTGTIHILKPYLTKLNSYFKALCY